MSTGPHFGWFEDVSAWTWSDVCAFFQAVGLVASDTMTMSDSIALPAWLPLSDSMTMTELLGVGFGFADTMTMADKQLTLTVVFALGIICPHATFNWFDAFGFELAGGTDGLLLSIYDADNSWKDSLAHS